MPESSCVPFLQWALPRLGLTWPGFRRVRRRVCKRIGHRIQGLRLADPMEYRDYLAAHPDEWAVLDSFCRISVSRFVRDRAVFSQLGQVVLPALAEGALLRGERLVRCWSAGCASGEEPYSLNILWRIALAPQFPTVSFTVLATDVDEQLLARARAAQYGGSSLREVPTAWREAAFEQHANLFILRPAFREGVELLAQDIRQETPPGPFDLILCRNLVFTYFDARSRRRTLERILGVLRLGGALVIGRRERLPEGTAGLEPWGGDLGIYCWSETRQPAFELSGGGPGAQRPGPGRPSALEGLR